MYFTDNSRGVNKAKDPAVVRFNDSYFMYYTICQTADIRGFEIGIAKSTNLTDWTKVGEIKPEGNLEANGICAPGAIVLEGCIHLFYQTYGNGPRDAICHAVSEDGLNFQRNSSNPILRPSGEWNNGRAIDADVVLFGNYLYLYYATRDPKGEIQMLGVARASAESDFGAADWEQYTEKSILQPELPWEQQCIEAPAAIVRDDKVYLFYAGAYNNCPQQIGLAVSEDGVQFKRVEDRPFLPNGEPGSWNASESGHPYIFEDADSRIYLFYQGNNDQGASWYLSKEEVIYVPAEDDGDGCFHLVDH